MKLLVTADDLGYCEERDAGIFEGVKAGIIKNISFMVNGVNAQSAAKVVKTLEQSYCICVGLHINFTEGKPIHSDIPSLLDKSGSFLGKLNFRESWNKNLIEPHHITQELNAQIDRFYSLLGYFPHHVDSHQHTHQIPSLSLVILPTLLKRDIHSIRTASQSSNLKHLSQFLQQVHRQTLISKEQFAAAGLFLCEGFIGLRLMGNGSLEILEQEIKDVMPIQAEEATIEWMCHPGFCCDSQDDFSASTEREDELNLLLSNEIKEMFSRYNIVLACWPNKAINFK